MIQRVQSLWLLLASVFTFLTLKLPFYTAAEVLDGKYHEVVGTDSILVMIFTIALGVLALINIFLYKTRHLQFRLCIVAIVLDVLVVLLYLREIKDFSKGQFSITSILHILIIAALIFAAKGIRNDGNLIKESDRLR